MRTFARILTIVASLAITGGALEAQRAGGGMRPMRPQLRGAMTDTARRQAMRQRLQSLTPEQRAAMRQRMAAARIERQRLVQGMRSGQLTRAQARAQLRQWQRANRLQNPRPGSLRPLKP